MPGHSRLSRNVFPAPFIDDPRRNKKPPHHPGRITVVLAFILGLALGWVLRGGGALLP